MTITTERAAVDALALDDLAPADLPPRLPLQRRVWRHQRLMHHNRLAAAMILVNVGVAAYGVGHGWWSASEINLSALSTVTLANFAVAIIIRQQYVINLLFWLATRAPVTWPLRVRWTLAKVYHFGGVHVGAALAGTLWFVTLVASETYAAVRGLPGSPASALVLSYLIVGLLLGMVALARPSFRAAHHDVFERVHRFGGWTALLLLWVLQVITVRAAGDEVLAAGSIWTLAVITFSVVLPWLRLRRVRVDVERPSSHVAIARFDYGHTPFAGSSTAISRSPLREWHSFANVPSPTSTGFRLTISRAGDWTGRFIDDPPTHVWVKGITTAGVANIETLFRKVVYVATGSGIGPVLPHLLAGKVPALLVWATRSPRATYGDALVDEILAVQPDATIFDTSLHGKPDMIQMAYDAYADFGAEAVICISNKKLTWQVVQGLEERGIPAYGAIWDS